MKKYPLSPSQLGVFLECMTYPDTTQYNLPHHAKIDLCEDVEALAGTWKRLIRATPTLRTRFEMDGEGNPRQWPDEDMPIHIPVKSVTEAEAEDYIQGGFVRPFDLLGGEPLFRIEIIKTETQINLLMDFHHLVVDGFSYSSMTDRGFKSFFQGVGVCPSMGTPTLAHPCASVGAKQPNHLFFELAEQEEGYFASEEYRAARDYFVSSLQGTDLTGLSPVSAAVGRLVSSSEYMDKKTVDEWCRKQGIDAPSLFQAAFALTLGRLARTEEPAYLTSYLNRATRQRMKAQGMLVNQVAIKASLPRDLSALDFLREMGETSARAYAMGRYPFIHLSDELGVKPRATFNFRPVKQILNLGDRKYPVTAIPRPTGQMDMDLDINLAGSDYEICATSSDAVNSEETVKTFARAVKTVLMQILDNPAASLQEISLTGEEEKREILALSRGETLEYDASETWLDLFQSHVKKDSEKTAVVDSKGAFSYGELDRASDSIAAYLLEKGVRPGSFVALKMGRVKEFLAAVIAVHKVGAGYVPIDPEYPEERTRYMLEDSEARVVLTEETIREAIAEFPDATPVNHAVPEGRAYMIYTSGSTGRPKGVVQSHFSLRAFVAWRLAKFDITGESVHALHASFSFDASLDDVICPIAAGGTLHILPEDLRRDMGSMGDYLARHHISMATFSTQLGMAMVNQHPELPLLYLMMGGEKMLPCKRTDIRLINGYGPTEFTVCSSYHVVDQEKDANIPIGRPVPNTWSFICDPYGHLLPRGMAGELCLAGSQLAEGYWKKPELTAKSFVECSFLPGQKMYRTGDLARYNEEGQLEYQGRIDNQVKLRGFRIEMGEIESRAALFGGMRQVAAAVKRDQLVLYYTSEKDARIDVKELRSFLSETLPYYMVPPFFMQLDSMPENANGKLDYGALPPMELPKGEYVPPKTEGEKLLCELFAEVLNRKESVGWRKPGASCACARTRPSMAVGGRQSVASCDASRTSASLRVGSNDSFFALGGDSIAEMQLVGHLMERYGISCTMSQLVANPTPAALSQILSEAAGKNETFQAAAAEAQKFSLVGNYTDSVKELLADSHIETALPVNAPTSAFLYMKQEGIKDRFNTTRTQIRLESSWNEEGFRERVSALVRNHPALRSFFHRDERGKYWQVIRREAKTPVWFKDISHLASEAAGRFARGFWQVLEGEEAPFAAACLAGAGQTTLLVQAEHTVVDGMSMCVIANELVAENYRDLPVDGYIAHRQRTLGSREGITPFILDYYGKGTPAFWSVDPADLGTHGIQVETVALSRQDTDRFLKTCASSGILPYNMALYNYGQAILAVSGLSEVWLLALDSGRYAEWGDELRIVGNLISGVPIRIAGDMTVCRFQEDLLRLREYHHLQDSVLIHDGKWRGIPGGIVSNDLMELNSAIASLEVLGDDKRRGNSMAFLDGCLTIRLRHADTEPVNDWYRRTARELSLRLKAVSASFGGNGDEKQKD